MSENTISTLKKEIASFFNSIGLNIEFKDDDWGNLLTFNIDEVICVSCYKPEDNFLSISINGLEESLCFTFDASLPSGQKLQPLYHEINENAYSQLAFFVEPLDFTDSSNFSFEHYTFLVVDDYTFLEVNRSERGNELHPKKGEILLHEVRDDKEFEYGSNYTVFITNRIVPDLQFKSQIPEIQDWIEQQVA